MRKTHIGNQELQLNFFNQMLNHKTKTKKAIITLQNSQTILYF